MKRHLLYNRLLDITQEDVINASDLSTIVSWYRSIKELIAGLPETGRGLEKKRAVLETFRLALREKLLVYKILEIIELKERNIYNAETYLCSIFQEVASERLDAETYQQIMDMIPDNSLTSEDLKIEDGFMNDFDLDLE